MKSTAYILIFLLLCIKSYAQTAGDLIILNTGAEIPCKITEIDLDVVKYKKADAMDGPTYSIRKSDIKLIRYPNGKVEKFEGSTLGAPQQQTQVVPMPAPSAPTSSGWSNSSNGANTLNYGTTTSPPITNPEFKPIPGLKYKKTFSRVFFNIGAMYFNPYRLQTIADESAGFLGRSAGFGFSADLGVRFRKIKLVWIPSVSYIVQSFNSYFYSTSGSSYSNINMRVLNINPLNFRYEITMGRRSSLFLGAGIGYSHIFYDESFYGSGFSIGYSKQFPSPNIYSGLGIRLWDTIELDFRHYSFYNASNVDWGGFTVGANISF